MYIKSSLVVAAAALAVLLTLVRSEPPPPGTALGGPPEDAAGVFVDPGDLKNYLAKLNNYYQLLGRPRFGKRRGADLLSGEMAATRREESAMWKREEIARLLRRILYKLGSYSR